MEHSNHPIGTVRLPTGASKPRAFYSIDPRLFIPISIVVLIGMFGRSFTFTAIMFLIAGLIWFAGSVMGVLSPYFIDEFAHWIDWRIRTGRGAMPPDAYFYGRKSMNASRWRPR